MDLRTIEIMVANGRFDLLKRNKSVGDLYLQHIKNISKEWNSIEDFIKAKCLNAIVAINDQGLKYAYFDEPNELRYSLTFNEYPYDVGENIKHLVLWSTQPFEQSQIEEILMKEFPITNFFWFEQPLSQKSVKGIWHVHVFAEF